MNTYKLDLSQRTSAISAADWQSFLASLAIGYSLSSDFSTDIERGGVGANCTTFRFSLPFSLSNVIGALASGQMTYDTRFQAVKEFLDKPYVVAGRIVCLVYDQTAVGAYDIRKDMDNFLSWTIQYYVGAALTTRVVYLGVANGTLSESYAPFGVTGGAIGAGIDAIKIYDPNDISIAAVQDVVSVASSNLGGPIPIGGGVLNSSVRPASSPYGASTGINGNGRTKRPMLTKNGIVWQ